MPQRTLHLELTQAGLELRRQFVQRARIAGNRRHRLRRMPRLGMNDLDTPTHSACTFCLMRRRLSRRIDCLLYTSPSPRD